MDSNSHRVGQSALTGIALDVPDDARRGVSSDGIGPEIANLMLMKQTVDRLSGSERSRC